MASTYVKNLVDSGQVFHPPRPAEQLFLGVSLKWVSLVFMVVQMVGMVLILRVSRTEQVDGPRYLNTTAILFAEMLKFHGSLFIHWIVSKNFREFSVELRQHFLVDRWGLARSSVPSLLYTLQNNLLFIGLSNLSAGLYQVTYQFKILTTAALSFVVLGTRLSAEKWFALFLLTVGVMLVNVSGMHKASSTDEGNTLVGLAAVIVACFTSGFAGVYTEKILKSSSASLWIRNMQLALFGMMFAFVIAIKNDGQRIRSDGFTQGYTSLVWTVVVCQAFGGFLSGAVMKYADNILKCFGCAIAIIFTCLLSVFELREFTPDSFFLFGTIIVLISTGIYSLGLPSGAIGTLATRAVFKLPKGLRHNKSESFDV